MSQTLIMSKDEWDIIERPILKLVKHVIGVSASFPSSGLYHEGIVSLNNLWQYIITYQIANFINRLNTDSLASKAAIIRLRQSQIRMRITYPLFEINDNHKPLYIAESKHNFAVYCLTLASQLNISLKLDSVDHTSFTILGDGLPILDIWL
jgi:hypothetical protein